MVRTPSTLAPVIRIALVALVALGVAGSPAVSQSDPGQDDGKDRAAIEQAWAGYSEALTGGDGDAFASLFTDDAVWRQPVVGELRGRDAVRDFITGGLQAGSIDRMTIESQDLRIHGDRAYEVGLYGQTTTFTATGESRDTGGAFGAWWQRGDDGVWRISHMMIVPAAGRPTG